MRNNKGFTLVELLAMLVVLGILMGVTIPNITGILTQSKQNALIEDATKMVESAKIKYATRKNGVDKIPRLQDGNCAVFTLDYLNDNEDIGKGPNDGIYLDHDSYVVLKKEGSKNKYYVRLVEEKDSKYSGIDEVDYEVLEKDGRQQIKKITTLKNFDTTTQATTVKSAVLGASCTVVEFYK